MAVQDYQFGFHNVELFKEDNLGTGSYGGVSKARCDGFPCAAKIMHPTLFDLRDPGTVSYLQRFEEECRLLSSARHPNVVQYLGTYRDPETHLPVLLMELCDESLCRFLERSPRSIPYHIQVNITHDIALALVYLHLNNITHRDLTANNVLMIAGVRAKVTDFGMSKLASVNPHTTPMTLCPGNVHYMSPEALEEPPSYTHKLDVFSFGVLLVQIMTRQFPKPGPRFKSICVPGYPDARVPAPETERRSSHLRMIADTHPLKTIAITCLKSKEEVRPSAQRMNKTLSGLKQEPAYTQSLQQAQTDMEGEGEVESLRSQIQDLQQQNHTLQEEMQQKEGEVESLRSQIQDLQQQNHTLQEETQQKEEVIAQRQRENEQLQAQVQQFHQELQGQQVLTEAKTREVLQLQNTVQEKERELQEKDHVIRTSEQLVAQFQQALVEKDRVISDLQQIISAQNQPASGKMDKTATATVAQKDVSKLKWKDGKKAPDTMSRGSAVVDGNTVYINAGGGSIKIYSCQFTSQDLQWSTLPDTEYYNPSLAVIDGILTTVGGYQYPESTNSLLSLTGRGRKQWSEIFPAMPTPRSQTVSVTTQQTLIVAGGVAESKNLNIVEVMDIPNRQWTTASHLPHPFGGISGVILGDQLYLAGGNVGYGEPSKSVLTCSVTDLLSPPLLAAGLRSLSLADKTGVWRHVRDLTVIQSTLITFGGHLLAIGGRDDSRRDTADVHCYDTHTDSWQVVSKMEHKRRFCLAAVLPEDCLLVVGGSGRYMDKGSVEIGRL